MPANGPPQMSVWKLPREKTYQANTPLNGDTKIIGKLDTNSRKNTKPRITGQPLQNFENRATAVLRDAGNSLPGKAQRNARTSQDRWSPRAGGGRANLIPPAVASNSNCGADHQPASDILSECRCTKRHGKIEKSRPCRNQRTISINPVISAANSMSDTRPPSTSLRSAKRGVLAKFIPGSIVVALCTSNAASHSP